ncbi:MAG: hypothetical protein LBS37_08745 [Treponema sp.]|jgi:hypothetical protein|nr:hypothetical protein [Treponema sp.]
MAVSSKPAKSAKPAAKKSAAKPAAKKTAVKATAKAPAKKPAAKPAVKRAAVKPPVDTPAKIPASTPGLRVMDLFDAYAEEKLPRDHGYIISSFFSSNSTYSIYEIVSYSGVKEILFTETGLEFRTAGKKLHILVEPASYASKHVEPVSRKDNERIPKRYSELEKISDRKQNSIYVSKEPNESYGSFVVLKPTGDNFARVLYNLPDVYETLRDLFAKSFNQEAGVPQADAKTAAKLVSAIVERTMSFKGEYS